MRVPSVRVVVPSVSMSDTCRWQFTLSRRLPNTIPGNAAPPGAAMPSAVHTTVSWVRRYSAGMSQKPR